MKTVSMNFFRMSTLLGMVLLTCQLSVAGNVSEKVVERARYAVEQAAPHDWYTLAKSAKKCIRRGVNLKEAVAWLEQSVEIKRTPYNLEVLGDYYAENSLPNKAISAYSESYRRGFLTDEHYQGNDRVTNICQKIQREVVALGRFYNNDVKATLSGDISFVEIEALLKKTLGSVW